MSFLLDTNICSAQLRDERRLFTRLMQHQGNLFVSRLCIAELYAWVHLSQNPVKRENEVSKLLVTFEIVEFDEDCSREYGRLRAEMQRAGTTCPAVDLMIAATALVHNLTLVTHNLKDFQRIPNLSLTDWLTE